MGEQDPSLLRDLLGSVGRRLGMPDAAAAGRVFRSWAAIVGPAVAEHARPTSLRGGVLRVTASSPAWATEIAYLASRIRDQVNEAAGGPVVSEVRVRTGRLEKPAPREREAHPRAPVSAVTKASYDDPVDAFERARAAWQERRRRGPGSGRSTC